MTINDRSRVEDVYKHPVGRDVIDKILLQTGKSTALLTNPFVSRLRLGTIKKLTGRILAEDFWDSAYWLLNSEPDQPDESMSLSADSNEVPWWKEAVFYQIYPRSFCDSNADGIGDLGGIISKLDYLQDLGVDALWLSPIYDSPNDDNGYDIRDYRAIMAEMGSMADFDRLLAELHRRKMRIILDLVINHTSDEHEWFQKALADPEGPYGRYYFLRRGEPDKLPNNWRSFFSGPAWRWFPKQKLWALHLFSSKQMDLNWGNAALRQELAEMVRWWLDKGVDGFRLDVINYISKREGLPDGNRTIGDLMLYYGIENYYYGPKLHDYLRELRREAFDPYQAFSVGETPGVGIEMGRLLSASNRRELDLIFNFDHLEMPGKVRFDRYRYDLNYLKQYYIKYHDRLAANDWLSVFWDNHDNPLMLSKIDSDPRRRKKLAKLLLTLQLSLKGTVFLFQGQELGRVNQPFTDISQLRDIESLNKYRELLTTRTAANAWETVLAGTRDHARVAMRWDDSAYGGFSEVSPWLAAAQEETGWSAAAQASDENSVLQFAKRMLALRKGYRALRLGEITYVDRKKHNYLAYYRELDGVHLFCEYNLSDQKLPRRKLREKPSTMASTARGNYRLLISNREGGKRLGPDSDTEYLEAYEAAIYLLD